MAGKLALKQIAQGGASNGQVLTWSNALGVWQPAAGGGGGGLNTGSVTVDFGATPSDLAVVTVSETWVTATNHIFLSLEAFAADHDPEDVVLEQLTATVGNRVVGVSFDIFVAAPTSTWGRFTCYYAGV